MPMFFKNIGLLQSRCRDHCMMAPTASAKPSRSDGSTNFDCVFAPFARCRDMTARDRPSDSAGTRISLRSVLEVSLREKVLV